MQLLLDLTGRAAQVLVIYRPGNSDGRHAIKAGVPEADKHEALTAAARPGSSSATTATALPRCTSAL